MVISKKTTPKELKNIKNGQPLEITKDVSLNTALFSFLLKNFPESEIKILTGYDSHYISNNQLYNEQELLILAENIKLARRKFNKDILFEEGFTFEQAVTASRKINTIVKDIESARIHHKPLSNLEKFLWAYKETTNHFYKKEDEGESPAISRDIISILNGDKIVCVGFSNMLFTLCNRLKIPCTLQTMTVCGNDTVNHMTCVVRIDDDKYGIHSIFHSDPTYDCKKTNDPILGKESFDFALVPFEHLDVIYSNNFLLDKIISKEDIKGLTAKEILETKNYINKEKILSFLFPEKTQGASQDLILQQQAKNDLKKYDIENTIKNLINSIDDQKTQTALNSYIEKRVFNFSSFFDNPSKKCFEATINNILQELSMFGYSKSEIISLFNKHISKERIISDLTTWCADIEDYGSPEYVELLQSIASPVKKRIESTPEIIESFDFENHKRFDTELEIDKTIIPLAQSCIDYSISTNDNDTDLKIEKCLAMFGILTKNGVPIEKIKDSLKEKIKGIDIGQLFFSTKYKDLIMYYKTNENDFYFSADQAKFIYNKPYEEDFLKLTSSATPLSKETLFEALYNIYRSQTHSETKAKKLAEKALSSTTFPFEKFINNNQEYI